MKKKQIKQELSERVFQELYFFITSNPEHESILKSLDLGLKYKLKINFNSPISILLHVQEKADIDNSNLKLFIKEIINRNIFDKTNEKINDKDLINIVEWLYNSERGKYKTLYGYVATYLQNEYILLYTLYTIEENKDKFEIDLNELEEFIWQNMFFYRVL